MQCHAESGIIELRLLDGSAKAEEKPTVEDGVMVPQKGTAILCFQRFNLYNDGKPIQAGGRKAEELIALLACSDSPLTKRACAGYLWPESDSAQGLDSLRKLLARIHKAGVPIEIKKNSNRIYIESDSVYCDVREFRMLCARDDAESHRKAILLYRGPLLFEEAYEWANDFEALYDILYNEILGE